MSNRDGKGRFVKGHKSIPRQMTPELYKKMSKYFFKKGNNIRNTGRTRFKKGNIPPLKGKKHSYASKLKMRIVSREYILRKSCFQKGITFSKELIQKRIKTRRRNGWWKNKENTLNKMGLAQKGNKGHNWKGGITSKNKLIRSKNKWKIWRKKVFEKDNYTCQECNCKNEEGLGKTIMLHPHHIFSLKDCLKFGFEKFIFDIDNGRTLCVSCHKLEHKKNRK